jgi:hypothetical protein
MDDTCVSAAKRTKPNQTTKPKLEWWWRRRRQQQRAEEGKEDLKACNYGPLMWVEAKERERERERERESWRGGRGELAEERGKQSLTIPVLYTAEKVHVVETESIVEIQ